MKDFFKNLRFAWKYAESNKKVLFFMMLCNIISIVFYIIAPIHTAEIISALTTNKYLEIMSVALVILLVEFFASITEFLIVKCSVKIYRDTLTNIELDLASNVLKLKNNYLDKNRSGFIIERMTNDTTKLAESFNNILELFTNFIKYIGILIAIFIINVWIFIFVLFCQIILYFIEKVRTDLRNEDDKKVRILSEKVTGSVNELVDGAREIKMLNIENNILTNFKKKITNANNKKYKMESTTWNYRLGMWEISNLENFLLIILLVLLMEDSLLTASMALVLFNFVNTISGNVNLIGEILEYIKSFNLSTNRLLEIINEDESIKECFGDKTLKNIKGNIEFDDVKFKYEDTKRKVLKGVSFKLEENDTVALVGKSGCGKTTIFNLISKLYDNWDGTIKIDGIDIRTLDKNSIRKNVTIIGDDPYIFNMSIKDNLKLVNPNINDDEIKKVCKEACLDSLIEELPDGYDTIIGERGYNLSPGQKQRISIARALVQKTKIILFDETTSTLDNETQEKLLEALLNIEKKYTLIIIAKRSSTLKKVKNVIFLEKGIIMDEGTHNYLLKNNSSYKKLYEDEISKD